MFSATCVELALHAHRDSGSAWPPAVGARGEARTCRDSWRWQTSKDAWEARRPNPMKKGGWLKISSRVGADAQAQAELAVAKDSQAPLTDD